MFFKIVLIRTFVWRINDLKYLMLISNVDKFMDKCLIPQLKGMTAMEYYWAS